MSTGKILLIGFGPGSHEHMTFRAREAIEESDVVIGYSTYIGLVKDLLKGKEVIRKGMTEETDRAVEAFEHARQGKVVALVSSGDIGVYGMAGPSYEVLFQAGWKPGGDIEVELVPGTTALSSCAARVGSPLTHDFCSISLSDLLTPWPTIVARLDAAAASDFVTALYNPKSGRRRQQIVEAQRIFLKYRSPETPVAIVKSAYRKLENIQMVTLKEMSDCDIGMLTTVLIGNSSTFMKEGLMVTPRGYANKYKGITGEVIEGEKKGRSLSLGLEGWKESIRQALTESNGEDASHLANKYGLSIDEIFLALISFSDEDGTIIDWARELNVNAGLDRIARLEKNQTLTCFVGDKKTGQTQIMINGSDLKYTGNQLVLNRNDTKVTIDTRDLGKVWSIERDSTMHSIWLLNKQGDSVMHLQA